MAKKKTTETAQETVEEPKKTFTADEVNKLIANALDEYIKSHPAEQPKVVQVSTEKEMVRLLFMDDCSDDNELRLGANAKFGTITGPIAYLSVPKEAFLGEFRDNLVQMLLASRKLIVLDGLTDEEREMHGVKYADGEVMDERLFRSILDHIEELPNIYKKLCPSMKQIVATRFQTGFDAGDPRVLRNRDVIVKLNKISKKDFADAPAEDPRKNGLFINIVQGLNKNDEE